MKHLINKYKRINNQHDNDLKYQQQELAENNKANTQITTFILGFIISLLITGNLPGSFCVGGIFWCANRLNTLDTEKKISHIEAANAKKDPSSKSDRS